MVFTVPDDMFDDITSVDQVSPNVPAGRGERRECPECGKSLTVNADGSLRGHKCANGVTTVNRTKAATTSTRKRGKGKRLADVPANVQRVGTAALASGIEWTARTSLASYIPCPREVIPSEVTDIPDAGAMVGPLVKFIFPQLPVKAQSLVTSICDNEELILCALAWWDYSQKLQKFGKAAHAAVLEASKSHATTSQGVSNGVQGPVNGTSVFAGVEPFSPESVAG